MGGLPARLFSSVTPVFCENQLLGVGAFGLLSLRTFFIFMARPSIVTISN
jgi:hypothetical protein